MKKNAILSADRIYRYVLSREWDERKPYVMFIGLNPSTADENADDPTINKCINFAKNWGYGGIYMLNLFAFRTTYPDVLFTAEEPIGNENDQYLEEYAMKVDKIICAWGNNGDFKNRSQTVKNSLEKLYYLKMNKTDEPAHPLYLAVSSEPMKWN